MRELKSMRLEDITRTREEFCSSVQNLPHGDYSDSVGVQFSIRPPLPPRRRVLRYAAKTALRVLQPTIRRKVSSSFNFDFDLLSLGERFANDAGWSHLLGRLPPAHQLDVLVPGCYMAGEDVQFWLRHGARHVSGFDIYSLDRHWDRILPKLAENWETSVDFRQASIEDLPYADESFDVLVSDAVLEHVRNISAMARETARVLKPSGYALHSFGPLYYSFGADHCISAYGKSAGYDHLLLDNPTYRTKIGDRSFFSQVARQPELAFWALNDQFSFATARTYLKEFEKHFEAELVIAKISPDALEYRATCPERWRCLIDAGVAECDLLTKGLVVVLKRKLS